MVKVKSVELWLDEAVEVEVEVGEAVNVGVDVGVDGGRGRCCDEILSWRW